MTDLNDYRQRKQRGFSVKQAVESASNKADSYESIVIVSKRKDGGLDIGYSGSNNAELIGLLEMVKAEILEDSRC